MTIRNKNKKSHHQQQQQHRQRQQQLSRRREKKWCVYDESYDNINVTQMCCAPSKILTWYKIFHLRKDIWFGGVYIWIESIRHICIEHRTFHIYPYLTWLCSPCYFSSSVISAQCSYFISFPILLRNAFVFFFVVVIIIRSMGVDVDVDVCDVWFLSYFLDACVYTHLKHCWIDCLVAIRMR